MSDPILSNSIEDDLRQATCLSQPSSEFLVNLRTRLGQEPLHPVSLGERFRLTFFRPAWATAAAVLILFVAGLFAVGPQRVFAAFIHLFGYIPGVGIVDQSAPIRVLAGPVSVTRDGITITVTSATLTGNMTYIDFRIFGVPASAYPDREDVSGCLAQPYLRLADGAQLTEVNYGYQPVPAKVNEAVFVMPCIFETIPGKAPKNWEFPLSFAPAPPNLTVMPVVELSQSLQASPTADTTNAATQPVNGSGTPIALVDNSVTVSKEIETSDGYILIGQFQPQSKPGESIQVTGAEEIQDASGKKVSYSYPQDINQFVNQEGAGTGWAVQFKAGGLVYPLTISFSGVILQPADPNATAEFTFDAGSNPQPGQVWNLDQDIQLAGHTLTLVSITADSRGGYSFSFKCDPDVFGAGVQIDGSTPNGGGGGGGGSLTNGTFNASLSYAQLPTDVLTVILSNLTLVGDPITWQGQWTPATIRTDLPANPTTQPGVCLTTDSIDQLHPAPAGLFDGTVLMNEPLDNLDKWGLVLYNLDGSGKQVLASDTGSGSFSPDGTRMAYPAEDGIHIIDLVTKADKVLPGIHGSALRWSPDGKQIAYFDATYNDSVFVVNTDGGQPRQVSEWSYESPIGWSSDGTQLYFVAPYTGGAAWKVYAYDLAGGATQELFTIENGTPKFLNPTLSPNGNWIAYRGWDNSSLYLVHPDGTGMHLVLDNVGAVGIAWSQSGWLGVSMQNTDPYQSTNILINPDGCQVYLLPALHGQLEGMSIP